jgi:cholesterol oxidase
VIGAGPEQGVVDARNRIFGYENLMVCDGSAIPANPGVNPSLTITALTEHAMAQVPPKDGADSVPALPEAARPAASGV